MRELSIPTFIGLKLDKSLINLLDRLLIDLSWTNYLLWPMDCAGIELIPILCRSFEKRCRFLPPLLIFPLHVSDLGSFFSPGITR